MINKKKKSLKGFTLVELVVTIAVIAILAAVSVGAYFGITKSANISKLESEARTTLNTLRLLAIENSNGNYLLSSDGLTYERKDVIEDDLNKYTGLNYYVFDIEPEKIIGKTVYLYEYNKVSSLYGTWTHVNYFNYYSSDVAGLVAQVNIVSGKITVSDSNLPIEKDSVDGENPNPEVYYLNLDVSEIKLIIRSDRAKYKLNPTVSENLTNPQFTFESKDTDVVSVNRNGLLTAVGLGETEVEVKETTKNLSKTVKVIVRYDTAFLEIAEKNVTLTINNDSYKTHEIKASYGYPANNSEEFGSIELKYESMDKSVATVKDGVIAATGIGQTNIIVKIKTMPSVFEIITVNVEKEIKSLNIEDTNLTLSTNVCHSLSYSYLPSDATYNQLTWSSSDDSVVSVNNGVIYTHKAGDVVITLGNTHNSITSTINVTVVAPSSSMRFTEEEVSVLPGDRYQLNLITENINESSVVFEASNDNVEFLENNEILAKNVGTTIISAKINDLTASITINIIEVESAVEHKPINSPLEIVNNAKIILVDKEQSVVASYTNSDTRSESYFYGGKVEFTSDINKSGITSLPSYYSEFRLVQNGEYFNLIDQFYRTLSADVEKTLSVDGENDLWQIIFDEEYNIYVIENANPEIGRIYFNVNVDSGNRFSTYKEHYYKGSMSLPTILIKSPRNYDDIEWELINKENPLTIGDEVIIASGSKVVINYSKGYDTEKGSLMVSASDVYNSSLKGFRSFDVSVVEPLICKVEGTGPSKFTLRMIHNSFKINHFNSPRYKSETFYFASDYSKLYAENTTGGDYKNYLIVYEGTYLLSFNAGTPFSSMSTNVQLYKYVGPTSNRAYFDR